MKSNFFKFVFIISMIFNISIISTAGYVYYRHRHRTSMFGNMTRKEQFIFERIPLRPDQIKALNDRSATFRAEVDKKRDEIIRERKALLSLLRSGSVTKEGIDKEISKVNRTQEDIQRMVAMHILEEKSILDKDQQDQFFDLLDRSLEKRKHAESGPGGH